MLQPTPLAVTVVLNGPLRKIFRHRQLMRSWQRDYQSKISPQARPYRAGRFYGRLTQGVARGLALPWAIIGRAFSPALVTAGAANEKAAPVSRDGLNGRSPRGRHNPACSSPKQRHKVSLRRQSLLLLRLRRGCLALLLDRGLRGGEAGDGDAVGPRTAAPLRP